MNTLFYRISFFLTSFIFLIILGFGVSCAQSPFLKDVPSETLAIRPGEVRFIHFPITDPNSKLLCRGKEIKYMVRDSKGISFLVESYFSDQLPYSCFVQLQGIPQYEIKVVVEPRDYPAEKLKVNPKKIKLSLRNEKRVAEEQIVLNKIYNSSEKKFLFTQEFIKPLPSLVTSYYGTRRVYNKEKKGQHLGIDFRAAIGDRVPASNDGKVVFSGDLFYTGWTVIIDHGVDVFTVYGHLSRTLVSAGDFIKRGELLGLSGNTGRTSGPHLHWGIKTHGEYVDGFVLIDESLKLVRK